MLEFSCSKQKVVVMVSFCVKQKARNSASCPLVLAAFLCCVPLQGWA